MAKSRAMGFAKTVLVLLVLTASLAVAILYSLGRPRPQAVTIEQMQAREGVPVEVAQPSLMDFTDWSYCDGAVVADVRAMLRAKVPEIVEAVHVRVGEPVTVSQVLVDLRRTDLEASILAARAAYDEALSNYGRYERLVAEKVLSEDRLEQARTRRDAAAAVLQQAESRLEYTQVTSPVDGVVESRWVEPGEYKREGDELLSIVDLSTVEVSALVAERDVANLAVDMEADFQLESGPEWFSGRITRISPSTQDPNRFFDVYLTAQNRRTEGGWLMRPGMYAEARFVRTTVAGALAVPDDTIVREGNEEAVYAVEDGTAQVPAEAGPNPATGFLGRCKRGWARLAGRAVAQHYEEKQVQKARRVVVSSGLRQGESVEVVEGDVSASSLLIVNVSDDIRDGVVVKIVKGGQ